MTSLTHQEISAALRRRLKELEWLPDEMRRRAWLQALTAADRLRMTVPLRPRRFSSRR